MKQDGNYLWNSYSDSESVYAANVGVATVFKFLAGVTDRAKLNTARQVQIVDDLQSVYCNCLWAAGVRLSTGLPRTEYLVMLIPNG